MPAERVAVLGLGHMGEAMARRLSDVGFSLVLHNRTAQRAQELAAELGARAAPSPAEAAAQADVMITMVADDDAVRAVCRGGEGILAGAQPGSVTVQTSTILPGTVGELGAEFAERGLGFLDAPVSGSTATTAKGELAFMVGGSSDDLERARPVLEALGKRIFELGAVGNGAAVKLAVNDIIMALDVAISEALVLAEAAGVERGAAYDVFAGGAAGAPFLQYKRNSFLSPESTPPAFSLELAQKDMSLILALAERTRTRMAQAEVNLESLRSAAAALGGERDFSEVATHLRSQRARQQEE
ncbi:MAG TPA: NAD(P)-dependent oxidoreductase [Candidatus Limnocylindria bacterium]|nr:NAD(P)-dependent oxidoreductase [Candidatus Limnocylindria bacterium]